MNFFIMINASNCEIEIKNTNVRFLKLEYEYE